MLKSILATAVGVALLVGPSQGVVLAREKQDNGGIYIKFNASRSSPREVAAEWTMDPNGELRDVTSREIKYSALRSVLRQGTDCSVRPNAPVRIIIMVVSTERTSCKTLGRLLSKIAAEADPRRKTYVYVSLNGLKSSAKAGKKARSITDKNCRKEK
jgi:hypothetical protein